MNLCSDNHDEVCFETRTCPLCYVRSELNTKVEELQAEVKKLEERVTELMDEI